MHHHPARIRKIYKIFEGELDFKVIKFRVKIHKIEKKNCIGISVFGFKASTNINLYVKNYFQKTCIFIIARKKEEKRNVFIKDFNTFTYDT